MNTNDQSEETTYRHSFQVIISETIEIINYCRSKKFITSGLVLIYSAIDTMAWLSRGDESIDSTRKDYYDWVKKYLLPGSKLKGTAADLYAARCGILHSHSPEAKLIREGKANLIYYSFGNAEMSKLERLSVKSGKKYLVINFDNLFEAYQSALFKYMRFLDNNIPFANTFYKRAGKLFKNASPEAINALNYLFPD